ncbi:Uma2 family endonuclease [Methylomagnum sp.]
MSAIRLPPTATISEEQYLRDELNREIKHEYIDGYIYAMAGASRNHQRIVGSLSADFRNHLANKPCEAFSSDIKVKAGSKFFYPDVIVVCDDAEGDDYYTKRPVIVVEVLSRSTRRRDETIKRLAYQNLPSLQEYVLIEQDIVDVEVCRRSEGWVSRHFFMGDAVTFESIGLSLSVEAIYARVENEDVRLYFEEQARAAENPRTDSPASEPDQ